jgi:hypothetical protein
MDFFMYFIKHCFMCRPSNSTVSEDAGIEPSILRCWVLSVMWNYYTAVGDAG